MISAIIQARTGSTRLPNKVFSEIVGKPLIWHIVNRLRYSEKIERIIIATTINQNDDVIEEWAANNQIDIYRGSENDVLDRYFQAAKKFKTDIIVRITADDPFKDPKIIDFVIRLLENKMLDFAYNNSPPTFPEGIDTEVFTYNSIEVAALNSIDPFEREHVTQYFYRNKAIFRQANYPYIRDISNLRWTIDTELDLRFAREIYENLYTEGEIFYLEDILNLIERKPGLKEINKNVERSAMYKKG
jgi:spore coat polysaccharide biosynthesis protein SpsF